MLLTCITSNSYELSFPELYTNIVTFRKADATIEFPTFNAATSGDIRFQFMTTAMNGIFLQCTGTYDFVEVRLVCKYSFVNRCKYSSDKITLHGMNGKIFFLRLCFPELQVALLVLIIIAQMFTLTKKYLFVINEYINNKQILLLLT